jgi:hypothetical protein
MTAAFFDGADKPTEVPLKRRLKRAERSRQFKALALVLPLLLFLLLTFLGPLAGMLWRSVDDWEVRQVLPHTVTALADWDGKDVRTKRPTRRWRATYWRRAPPALWPSHPSG